MVAVINTSATQAKVELSNNDLDTLQNLLLGPEYKDLLQQKSIQEDPALLAKHLSSVITQALKIREERDESIQKFFLPILEKSLSESVLADPKPITEALYPVIGPAMRKTLNVSMTQMVNNMNELLENSLSPKSFRWRFDAWRTGKSYAEVVFTNKLVFQVEQVFLVHRETGLLLQHITSANAISQDPDIVSGMLTAIQDFLRDSFVTEKNSNLDTLKLGDLTVLIEHGPKAVIAAVIRGMVPSGMQQTLAETMESIHKEEHLKLNNYNGDSSQFDHLQPTLSLCLKNKLLDTTQEDKTEPTKDTHSKSNFSLKKTSGLALGLCIIAGIGFLTYTSHIEGQQWDDLQQALRAEPGIILSHTSSEDGVYQLHGLADSMARAPKSLINEYTQDKFAIESNFRPYLSLEPIFVQQRIEKALLPPPTVQLTLSEEVLHVNGTAETEWLEKLTLSAPLLIGVNAINLDKLDITDAQ